MRLSRLGALLTAALTAVAIVCGATGAGSSAFAAPAPRPQMWYLSLGDSLAQGVQPDGHGHDRPTAAGYADDLFSLLRAKQPGLGLAKLGCPGETTQSMISGHHCHYANGASQLTAALAFLQAHRGHVQLITVDIGANDVLHCTQGLTINQVCLSRGMRQIERNLPVILHRIRTADPSAKVRFAGMDLYDPILAAWYQGRTGVALASQSLKLVAALDTLLSAEYRRAGFVVAPVAHDFLTWDRTPIRTQACGTVPADVAAICGLTWAAAPKPFGPDIHANASGYWVIAASFRRALAGRAG